MKDRFEVEVKVGDTIVYATSRSSRIMLNKAEVLAIEESNYGASGEALRVKVIDGVYYRRKNEVILPNPTFIVMQSKEST